MQERSSERDSAGPRLIAGIAVILVGLALFTDATELLGSISIDRLWPAIVLAVGISIFARAQGPRKRRQGLLLVFLSLWFFVNTLELGGLDWRTSWPMAVVAFGAARLLAPRSGRERAWGGFLVLVGVWLQVSVLGLLGLSFEESWPLVLVLGGLWLIVTSFGFTRSHDREQEHES